MNSPRIKIILIRIFLGSRECESKDWMDNGSNTEARNPALKARRRNTVWSTVMEEQVIDNRESEKYSITNILRIYICMSDDIVELMLYQLSVLACVSYIRGLFLFIHKVLAQEIGGFGLKKRLDKGDRSVESYDFTHALKLQGIKPHHSDSEEEEEEETEEIRNKR